MLRIKSVSVKNEEIAEKLESELNVILKELQDNHHCKIEDIEYIDNGNGITAMIHYDDLNKVSTAWI